MLDAKLKILFIAVYRAHMYILPSVYTTHCATTAATVSCTCRVSPFSCAMRLYLEPEHNARGSFLEHEHEHELEALPLPYL